MSGTPVPWITAVDYLALDRAAEGKSEYHDGEMFPVVAASRNHGQIAINVGATLRPLLRGSPCKALASPVRVQATAANYVYRTSSSPVAKGEPATRTTSSAIRAW